MTHENAKNRFTKAVKCLVDERGPIKERLEIAYVSQLSQIDPSTDLPADMVTEFDTMRIRLGEDQVQGDRGNAASQLNKISESEASKIAGRVFSMFLRLHDIS